MATHTAEEIDALADALVEVVAEHPDPDSSTLTTQVEDTDGGT
jgi:hypothetical protein